MIELPRKHGLRRPFCQRLRELVLQWDKTTYAAVNKKCLSKLGIPIEVQIRRNFRWVAARVPRHVPDGRILAPALEALFNEVGNEKDAKIGKALFNEKAWKSAWAVIDLVKLGFLSDVPDVPMYEKKGVDKFGIQKWRCVRGTNKVEGGPHADVYRKFAPFHCKLPESHS